MSISIAINVDPTPEQIAEEVAHWTSDKQAVFLRKISALAGSDGFNAPMQIQYVAEELAVSGYDISGLIRHLELLVGSIKQEAET